MTVVEFLKYSKQTQKEFSQRIGIDERHMRKLIHDEKSSCSLYYACLISKASGYLVRPDELLPKFLVDKMNLHLCTHVHKDINKLS